MVTFSLVIRSREQSLLCPSMASSTMFRGRRIVDPIPVQRGPLPREGKYRSSFSDLAAAWENVGEVKSALQAAEARINEANAGLNAEIEENNDLDVPFQEVFSERQRYGRVARYDLRPNRFGLATTSASELGEHENDPRQTSDFSVNKYRSTDLPSRPPVHVHPNFQSPPSKDVISGITNGGISRSPPLSKFPPHPSESGRQEPSVTTAYSSIYSTNNQLDRRSPVRNLGSVLSTISSSTSFVNDSLEVGGVPRLSRNEPLVTTALGHRPAVANSSDALARLKERIKQQKEQASRTSSATSLPRNISSSISLPIEGLSLDATAGDTHTIEEDIPMRTAISKRKVGSAPAAPAYKGFSEVESKTTALSEVNKRMKSRGPPSVDITANQRPQKPPQKKAAPKLQRIIAPRRPTDVITTSSWRTGQQTVKRILGPAKKQGTSSESSRPQSRSNQDTDISESNSLNFHWKDEDEEQKGAIHDDKKRNGKDTSVKDAGVRKLSPEHQEQINGMKKNSDNDTEPSGQHSSDKVVESKTSAERDFSDLKASQMLSTAAKNVLSDLKLYSDDESDKEIKKPIADPKPQHTIGFSRPPVASKRKRPLNSQSQAPAYPMQKMRHYDSEEVKKYIKKQQTERNKKLKEDRLLKERAVKEKQKKLEDLYNRQKKNLQSNLHRKEKKSFGETYSKGRSEFKSIIYPYNHPFPQDEVEQYSDDTGVSESDKENLDIASFRGLPSYATANGHDPMDNVSSSASLSSGDCSMSPVKESDDRGQVPFVTSVSVGTKPPDSGPSAYDGFREGNDFTRTRHELDSRSFSPPHPSKDTGELKPSSSPPRENRIAAIRQTAAQLRHRLETEAWRLGLNLQATGSSQTDDMLPSASAASTTDYTVFKGALPGVDSLREQAELNKELDSMTSAATTIQAAYRGYSVRQGLNWKLPSGRTLRSTVREGLQQRAGFPGAVTSESSRYSTAWDTVVPHDDMSSISDVNTSYSSARSTIRSQTISSKSVKDHRPSSTRTPSLHDSETRKHITVGHAPKHAKDERSADFFWNRTGGDSLSVINIFTRRNPHLKLVPKQDDVTKERVSEGVSVLEETHQDSKSRDSASVPEQAADLDHSKELLEETLVEEPLEKSQDNEEYDDDFELSSRRSKRDKTDKSTPSPDRKTDEPMYSETFESPELKTSSSRKEDSLLSPNDSMDSGTLSPTLSEGELSHASEGVGRSPTLTSTQCSLRREQGTQGLATSYTAPVHPPPSVFVSSHQGGDRLSPGSLDMRLAAELNKLEYMEESVRQLTDVERTRAVSLAQQETVSLAQILKSKQLSHARDMETLRAKAREEALEAAKQLEEARRAAADAAAGAAETIARMRLEAATTITESTDRLVKVQTEAARTTTESARQVEEARSSAARTLLEVAKQQTADTRGVAAEAASAAAEAAVRSTMSRFYEQQEQLQKEREERLKSYRDRSRDDRSRDSYSQYSTSDHTDSYSRSRTSRSGTDAVERASDAKSSPVTRTYASDDVSRGSDHDKTASSIHTASNFPVDRSSVSRSHGTPTLSGHKQASTLAGEETGSIPEEMGHSVADSVVSDVGLDVADDDSMYNVKKPSERLERSPEDEDYTLNFEESVISSHTATDDEIDFRMILPSESHRRRSLGRTGRSSSVGSDQGTVSYSSDDNRDSQDFAVDKMLEEVSAAPFSGEDSFTQFTSDMVRLMKEEEVRAKHQAGLLRLREKAVKEKTRAEMSWLECQKQRHRDKGADDVMPSIRKRQRGVLMRLQAEQAEIKRLKAANRAASYERRLLLMQQEEIARLRRNTKKIREKAVSHQGGQGDKIEEDVKGEQVKSGAESNEIMEELEDKPPGDQSTDQSVSEDIKTASPSASQNASVVDELPSYQSPGLSRSDSRAFSGSRVESERKRPLSEGESDDGSAKDGTNSATKGSPTASDSTVMQKLKKLKSQSGEKYLTLREQKLMKRRKEAENLLEDKKKLLEWEKRLDQEETLVRNLLNEALKLESSRKKGRVSSLTSEEEEHKDRSFRASAASFSVSGSPSSRTSGKIRSTQDTETISESIEVSRSNGHERSASERSVPEDIIISARDKALDSGKSRDSSIPEVEMKTRSQETSIPEEIPEEYVNDTFESLDSSLTPTHSTPLRKDLLVQREISQSPSASRRSSNDGSKSEEEASMTETSDHSDIESRVRRLRDQLELRKREVKRLYNERKKQRKAMLRAQEASLRQELQAVEMVISRTKAELNRPQTDSKRLETGSVDLNSMNIKGDSSEVTNTSTPSREIRYNLSRTSDTSGSRKLTPPEKGVSVSVKSGSAGGKGSSIADLDSSDRSDKTISYVPSLKQKGKETTSFEERRSLPGNEDSVNTNLDLDLNERSRSGSEHVTTTRRQSAESEHIKTISEKLDTEREIADEAKTAEDFSISEPSVVRSASKTSQSEHKSQSSSQSALRRQVSGSHEKGSVNISDEAKTAEDTSVGEDSEFVSKTKLSRPEASVLDSEQKSVAEKSEDDISERSSVVGTRESVVSGDSKSSRLLRSASTEKSRSSRTAYSSSFESVQSEESKTDDDISEHISIVEDAKGSEAESGTQDYRPTGERQSVKSTSKGEDENSKDISTKNENSEFEDILPSAGKTVSLSKENSIASQSAERSSRSEKESLESEIKEKQLPSYSVDELSVLDQTDEGKSGNLIPQASYTSDFYASGSNHDTTQQSLLEGVSGYLKEEGSIERSKEENKRPTYSQTRSLSLEQSTDEESIAEELDAQEDVDKFDDKDGLIEMSGKNDFETQGPKLQTISEESRVSVGVPAKTEEKLQPRGKYSDGQTADRIVHDLSTMLLAESVSCLTNVVDKRRKTTEDVPKTHDDSDSIDQVAAKAVEYVSDSEEDAPRNGGSNFINKNKEQRTLFKDEEEVFRWLGEEEEPEADIISLSGGEEEISGSNLNTTERGDLFPRSRTQRDLVPSHSEQRQQDLHVEKRISGEESNSVINRLSDALLMEAASQMISIMRAKKAKIDEVHDAQTADSTTTPRETSGDELHSGEGSPHSPPISNRFMAVQRFPEGVCKYIEENATPPGSPTDERRSSIDEKELAEKLDQLRRLHEHLDSARGKFADDGERLEFTVHTNTLIEFPTEDEDEEEEITRRSRAASFLFSVPHRSSEVGQMVASSLSFYFERKRRGLPIDTASPPFEIIGEDEADDDLEANSKRVYRRLVFDLSGNVLKELLFEEVPTNRPSWVKTKSRHKRRLHRGLQPLVLESDYVPVVEQEVLNLMGLGESRPSVDSVRRKTPLKAGKKDFVDAILIQELREEEPLWIDYDDDELAVKFQVADAIFESLLSETVMVVTAVQMRREARLDALATSYNSIAWN